MTLNLSQFVAGIVLGSLAASAVVEAAEFPFSHELEVLERDLGSSDYHAVLKTMIPTDLAAEWRRVATPDNYLLFAQQHGGLEQVQLDPKVKAAYDRRKQVATTFLDLIRVAYDQKKLKPPFADEAILTRALASGSKSTASQSSDAAQIQPVLPALGAEFQWPGFAAPRPRASLGIMRFPSAGTILKAFCGVRAFRDAAIARRSCGKSISS